MAKAKQTLQPSAEVIPILQASCDRLKKLLTLCEAEIDALINDSSTSAVAKARQIQILSRTIQGLQRDWLKYMAILHPNVPVAAPQTATKRLAQRDIELMSDEELRDEMFKLIRGENNDEDQEEAGNTEISTPLSPSAIVSAPDSKMDRQENSMQQPSFEGRPLLPSSSSAGSDRHDGSLPVTDASHQALSEGKPSGHKTGKYSEAGINTVESQANQSQRPEITAKRFKKLNEYRFRKKPPPN